MPRHRTVDDTVNAALRDAVQRHHTLHATTTPHHHALHAAVKLHHAARNATTPSTPP